MDTKTVRFRLDKYETLTERADQIAQERSTEPSLPEYIMEATKFFEDHRPKLDVSDE